jgi:hypothetical protein
LAGLDFEGILDAVEADDGFRGGAVVAGDFAEVIAGALGAAGVGTETGVVFPGRARSPRERSLRFSSSNRRIWRSCSAQRSRSSSSSDLAKATGERSARERVVNRSVGFMTGVVFQKIWIRARKI